MRPEQEDRNYVRDVAGKESGGKVRDRIGEEHSGARDLGGVTLWGGSKREWEHFGKGRLNWGFTGGGDGLVGGDDGG